MLTTWAISNVASQLHVHLPHLASLEHSQKLELFISINYPMDSSPFIFLFKVYRVINEICIFSSTIIF